MSWEENVQTAWVSFILSISVSLLLSVFFRESFEQMTQVCVSLSQRPLTPCGFGGGQHEGQRINEDTRGTG